MFYLHFGELWPREKMHAKKLDKGADVTFFIFVTTESTGCPNKHGNSVTNSISSLLWISIAIPNFKCHNSIMSARVYFIKRIKDCKDVCIMSPQDEQWRRTSVYCNFLVLLSTTVCSQNINKQNVNIADETLTDYSFLSRYHYTKSKNYLKRRYRIRHWIPMFIGTPCTTHGIKLAFSSLD